MKFHFLFHSWQIFLTNFFDDKNLIILPREEKKRERERLVFHADKTWRWIWRIEKIQPRERDTLAGFHPSPSIWYKGYQRLRNPSEKFLNPSSASRSRDKLIADIPEKSRKFILPGARVFVKIYEREHEKKRKGRIKSANWRPRSSLEPGKRGSKFWNERNERTECSKGVSSVNRSIVRSCLI